jgi:CelD/BcsL family acetyltransferase involved in cellulose biosynthesis
MLKVEEVTRAADLEGHREEWQDLVGRTDGALFFQTYEWMTSWIDRFWKDRPLAFLFVRNDQRLIGLAPLLADEEGRFSCPGSLVLASNEYSLRAEFLGGDILDSVVGHLRETRGHVRLALMNVQTDSPLLAQLPAVARRHHLSSFSRAGWSSPVVRFPDGWQSYLRSRSGHVRSELRRKNRRIEASGTVVFVAASTPEECARVIEDVISIEKNSWKHSIGHSLDLEPDNERFYRDLAQRSAAKGWLRMYILYLNSKPAAFVYGFVFRNEYYAFHTSFDDTYRNLSPGAILFSHVLRDACSQGLQVFVGAMPASICDFDSLREEARWKSEIATALCFRSNVCVFSRSQVRCHLSKAYHTRLKPFVKTRMPYVVEAKRRLRRLASH